jgi:TP901 family phage tail tape measure protein
LHASMGPASAGLGGVSIVALAAGAGLLYASDQAINLDRNLLHLQNNTKLTDDEMKGIRETILSLGATTGQSFEQLASGLRVVRDFGFDTTDSLKILDTAAKTATATGAQLDQTARILAISLKAGGGSAQESAAYMSALMEAMKSGNITMDMFNKNMDRVIALGAAMGMGTASVYDLSAAYAALTGSGTNATRAATGLVDTLNRIAKPTQEAQDELRQLNAETGGMITHFNTAGLATVGLNGIINELVKAYEKLGYTQSQAINATLALITGIRGGDQALQLSTTRLADYNKEISAVSAELKGDGVLAQEAWGRALDNNSTKWDQFTGRLRTGAATVGEGVAGAFLTAADAIDKSNTTNEQATQANLAAEKSWLGLTAAVDQSHGPVTQSEVDWQNYADTQAKAAKAHEATLTALDQATGQAMDDMKAALDEYQQFADGALSSADQAPSAIRRSMRASSRG